jgi:hypothetical protein
VLCIEALEGRQGHLRHLETCQTPDV